MRQERHRLNASSNVPECGSHSMNYHSTAGLLNYIYVPCFYLGGDGPVSFFSIHATRLNGLAASDWFLNCTNPLRAPGQGSRARTLCLQTKAMRRESREGRNRAPVDAARERSMRMAWQNDGARQCTDQAAEQAAAC